MTEHDGIVYVLNAEGAGNVTGLRIVAGTLHLRSGSTLPLSVRLFDGVASGDRAADTVFAGPFVSDECNGVTRDNAGNARPRLLRRFPRGLWQ